MSGSSLDGLDIAFVALTEISGRWQYQILNAECRPYAQEWKEALKGAADMTVPEFLRLHSAYGHYLGNEVLRFIEKHGLQHQVHFIASHGHTVWHEPGAATTAQIGDGAAIAAVTLLPVISDLRQVDVALGGQGAPIVPIADRLLFGESALCLNLGGIANVTLNGDRPIAFDICPANQLLDALAARSGKPYDDGGSLARSGRPLPALLEAWNDQGFYRREAPKSLHNGFVQELLLLIPDGTPTEDALHTAVLHMCEQIATAIARNGTGADKRQMLVTGGGAFNDFLIEQLGPAFDRHGLEIEISRPEAQLIEFKEAVAMALIGALRWREENNVLGSVTGARSNSINGAMWLPPVD